MTNEMWHSDKVAVITGGTTSEYAALNEHEFLIGQLDVCNKDSVSHFVELVNTHYGSPNILINSAGITVHQEVSTHTEEDWLSVIDTNLNGSYRMIRSCLPAMISSGWGRIVNIASTAATTASPTHAAYCASKSGLLGLTRSVALEGAAHGINCVSVSPTWVETDMLLHRKNARRRKEEYRGSQSAKQTRTSIRNC